jgi:hypothetical protein
MRKTFREKGMGTIDSLALINHFWDNDEQMVSFGCLRRIGLVFIALKRGK